MKKVVKKKNIIIGIVVILAIITLFLLLGNYKSIKHEEMVLDFKDRNKDLEDVIEANINKYGWLQVQGTNIDVPILKTTETMNDYSFGWISTNSIGYQTRRVLVGHNVLNVSSTPMVNNSILTDFEDLMSFVYYDFAKENMYVSFLENGVNKTYVIYAIGFYDYGYDNETGLNEKKEIKEYIKNAKANSIYKYDVDVNEKDDLLTVKTCTRYFGVDEKQQFILDLREIRENEKVVKYNVKKTKLYDEYKLVDSYKKNDEF